MKFPGDPHCVPAEVPRPLGTADAARIGSLDLLRGIALLGILFANITGYAHPRLAYSWPPLLANAATGADKAVWLFQFVAVDGKFRGIFTLLFGAGMALFMERAWERGADRELLLRRLLCLLAFGLAHYYLIWHGDILTSYAVWGIAALPLMRLPARWLLGVGLGIYYAGALAQAVTGMPATPPGNVPPDAGTRLEQQVRIEAARETRLMREGTWLEIAADRPAIRTAELVDGIVRACPETFSLILIGMALYRLGFFSRTPAPALRRWGWAGVVTGTALTIPLGVMVWRHGFSLDWTIYTFNRLAPLPRLPVVLGLAALVVAGTARLAPSPLGRRLVAAGRMPLTNYLGISLVMASIFQGWGVGLFGSANRLGLLPGVMLGWILMLGWSQPWLKHFRFGPLEWLWRWLTYGTRPPIRRV